MFRIDAGSAVPIYRQLVQQVRRDVMLGRLQPGDQLPSVKEVVDALSVNPNTVVKAFSELEHQGMIVRRQGVGTFVAAAPPLASLAMAPRLLAPLARWVERARRDGLSAEQIRMLVEAALDEPAAGDTAGGGSGRAERFGQDDPDDHGSGPPSGHRGNADSTGRYSSSWSLSCSPLPLPPWQPAGTPPVHALSNRRLLATRPR